MSADEQPLAELHRSGQLIARYGEVPERLRELSGAELAAAGRLLARLDPAAVLAAHPELPSLTIALTGHGTIAGLVGPLTAELARHRILARPHLLDFDSYLRDLSDEDSQLHAVRPDLVLCVLDPAVVFDETPSPWGPADVERMLAAKVALLDGLLTRLRTRTNATVVLNTLPLPATAMAQLVSHRERARLGVVWREGNAELLRLAERIPGVVVVDVDPWLGEGIVATDPRVDAYARAHLSDALLARYAREVGHLGRHLTGRTSKCLVLDLDQTLWGGVLGEDGLDGIEIGEGYRGEVFARFQRLVQQLRSQGVLLAVASKNDAAAVAAALTSGRMPLQENDFVRITANWQPKHENLRALAEDINLGLDSLVFVDDSPFECALVRRELPMVNVIGLDDEPALHSGRLLRDGWFDVVELTSEDRVRPARYREEVQRQDFLDRAAGLDDYLRELGVVVRLATVREEEIARVSQITLRTNQFNLTTQRMAPTEVAAALAGSDRLVLAIHARDRFGDNGLVGAIFGRHEGPALHIDNFLLSCRVFARGIEQACLAGLLRHAQASGAQTVFGHYRPTAKNTTVRELYPRYGFTPATTDGDGLTFSHALVDLVEPPDHVDLSVHIERSRP